MTAARGPETLYLWCDGPDTYHLDRVDPETGDMEMVADNVIGLDRAARFAASDGLLATLRGFVEGFRLTFPGGPTTLPPNSPFRGPWERAEAEIEAIEKGGGA